MADPGTIRREVALRDGRTFHWRAATPDDAELVWGWWTDPAMVHWNRQGRLEPVSSEPFDAGSVRAYLESHLSRPAAERALDPIVGVLDDRPVAYGEFWTKGTSPLASTDLPGIADEDRGMHLIVADRRERMRGLTIEVGIDAMEWQFDEWPSSLHALADPDVRNQGAISLCARIGMWRVALVPLKYKTACVMAIDRDAWARERPSVNALLDRLRPKRRRVEAR